MLQQAGLHGIECGSSSREREREVEANAVPACACSLAKLALALTLLVPSLLASFPARLARSAPSNRFVCCLVRFLCPRQDKNQQQQKRKEMKLASKQARAEQADL